MDEIKEFLETWLPTTKWPELNQANKTQSLCLEASRELQEALGEPAFVEKLYMNSSIVVGKYPISSTGHYVVNYEGIRIDLTARQFNENLPFPYIWE